MARSWSLAGRISMTVRARRSQLPASFGAATAIWLSTAMPVRKSFLANAASALRRNWASGWPGEPASALICASSSAALWARSEFWNGLSAALAFQDQATTHAAANAAATAARRCAIIPEFLPWAAETAIWNLRARSCRGRGRATARAPRFVGAARRPVRGGSRRLLDRRLTLPPSSLPIRPAARSGSAAPPQICRALAAAILYIFVPYGPVAQGIEQQPSKLKVAGSNPAGVASTINGLCEYRIGQSIMSDRRGPDDDRSAVDHRRAH